MKVLITGAGGFAGRHLAHELRSRSYEVIAAVSAKQREGPPPHADALDIADFSAVRDFIGRVRPEAIFHLAAQSKVMRSWQNPLETLTVNTVGTMNLLQAVLDHGLEVKFINVGSSDEYGLSGKDGVPLTETAACRPQNPYALSKYTAGQLFLQVAGRHGLQAIHLRPFNHYGPGQEEGFVISDFASQIARIERGLLPPVLRVGNLSAQRDFTCVTDVIRAYALVLESKLDNGVYNVCSGVPRAIEEILDSLLQLSKSGIRIETDPARLRPADVPVFAGSSALLREKTGWTIETDYFAGLGSTLDWWRTRYASIV